MRITHASVGSTDVLARRGGYLLHPFPGFVSGYDLVGTVEAVDAHGAARGLSVGQRVAAVLPRMGGHATAVTIPSALLVPVPDGIPSEVAATLPLDAVTAQHALDLTRAQTGDAVLIQGVTGAVGILAAQLGIQRSLHVFGAASARSWALAAPAGATLVDYTDPDWASRLVAEHGRIQAAIDHTGSSLLRTVVGRNGRVVRTAFHDGSAHPKRATAVGSIGTGLRYLGRPSEVACSTPLFVATHRTKYREDLAAVLDHVAAGRVQALSPVVYQRDQFAEALTAAASPQPGHKVVLHLG